MLRSRCYRKLFLRSTHVLSPWFDGCNGSPPAVEQNFRSAVARSPYHPTRSLWNRVALCSSRQQYSTTMREDSNEIKSGPPTIPIFFNSGKGRRDDASCASAPSSNSMHPHRPRETGIRRDVARQQFQQAFWTLCEDRRTCYRDDVVWCKLQPYREALTTAIQEDIRSPLFPAWTSLALSHASPLAVPPPHSVEEVPLMEDVWPDSLDAMGSIAAATTLERTTIEEEKGKIGGVSCRSKNLENVISIARRLPDSSVTEKTPRVSWHLENVRTEEDERELFVVDVILSTLLDHPDELAVLLTSVSFSSLSSSSKDTKKCPAPDENGFPPIDPTTSPSLTTPTLSHVMQSSSLSPRVRVAMLQSLLWFGRDGPTTTGPPSSSSSSSLRTTNAISPSVHLNRERIARLAGMYMGQFLQAFSSHCNEAQEGDSFPPRHRSETTDNGGVGKETDTRHPPRAMDGVWSAFFITACVGQMKSKLLDLWWNHMCVFYDRSAPSVPWHRDGAEEVENTNTSFGGREERGERIDEAREMEWSAGKEKKINGEKMHSGTMEKEEEENRPSWLELMSTMEEDAACGMASAPSSSSSASVSSFSLSEEDLKGEALRKRKEDLSLPYEAVAGVMAATADNSDIERTVHIFHVVKQRGLCVHAPSALGSSSWTAAAESFPRGTNEKDPSSDFSSSMVFLPAETPSSSSSTAAHSTIPPCEAALLQQHVHIRLLSKLLASTKFARNEDGGLRELVVSNLQRWISPSVLLQTPWEVISDILIGLNVASAMHLVKARAGRTPRVPSSSSSFASPSSEEGSTTRSEKKKKIQNLPCGEEEEEEKEENAHLFSVAPQRQKDFDEVPFFIWAALLRRCARDHMVDEAESLFSFLRACSVSIASQEGRELASIMVRMYATFSPPDSSDALHCFLEYILKNRDTIASASENKNTPTSPSAEDTVRTVTTSSRLSNRESEPGTHEKTKGVAAKHGSAASSFPSRVASGTPGKEDSTITDDVLYSLLIRSADSRNASMMYFLESCADGVPLSVELFESLFGSHSYQTSLRTLQKRLPHDYNSSKLDSLIRIPSTIDAHLRREEAQLQHGQPVVDSTGESC